MFKRNVLYFSAGLLIFMSCKVDPKVNTPLPTDNLVETIPNGWPQPSYTFSTNVLTEDGFILGRSLFYETLLSVDNTISCGSCHQDFAAFSNGAHHPFSHGVQSRNGTRNAPGLFNLAWHTSFMHDGGINHIESQPLGPITNTLEMAEQINNVIAKLQASEKYRNLFKKAFGTDEVTTQRMLWAIAQFQGLIYSYNSKYDDYKNNKTQLNDAQMRGYNLFLAKCNACHKEPLFSDFQFRNNGLRVTELHDSGRYHVDPNHSPDNMFRFKTPSLRNVAKTGPYMHDGRYSTLEQCLNHYTDSVVNMINLDPLLQGNGLQITPGEKQDIIAFLNTLTDYQFITDKRFADPNFN